MPIYGTKNIIIEEIMCIHDIEYPMKRVNQMWIRNWAGNKFYGESFIKKEGKGFI